MHRSLLLIICTVFYHLVSAQAPSANWTAPPPAGATLDYSDNLVLPLNSVFELKWTSTLDTYSIWLWQQDTGVGYTLPGNAIYTKTAAQDEVGSANWTVDLQKFTLAQSKIYFLSICQNNSLVGAFTSHYFTISQGSTSSTASSSEPASSSTATSSSSGISSASSSATQSSTSTPGPQAGTGMQTGTKVGLGVSLGLGIPLILLAAGLLAIMYRRYGRAEHGAPPLLQNHNAWNAEPVLATPQKPFERHELSALPPGKNYVRPRYELGHET